MDRQQVHEKLKLLRAELDQVEIADTDQREILMKVVSEIQDLLDQEEGTEHRSGLTERLREVVAQIEASHPQATLRIRQLIDQLAFMGI